MITLSVNAVYFPIQISFISFSCCIALARTSRMNEVVRTFLLFPMSKRYPEKCRKGEPLFR